MERKDWKLRIVAGSAIWMFGFFALIKLGYFPGIGFWATVAVGFFVGFCWTIEDVVCPRRSELPRGVKAYFVRQFPLRLLGWTLSACVAAGLLYLAYPDALFAEMDVTWEAVAGTMLGALAVPLIVPMLLKRLKEA